MKTRLAAAKSVVSQCLAEPFPEVMQFGVPIMAVQDIRPPSSKIASPVQFHLKGRHRTSGFPRRQRRSWAGNDRALHYKPTNVGRGGSVVRGLVFQTAGASRKATLQDA